MLAYSSPWSPACCDVERFNIVIVHHPKLFSSYVRSECSCSLVEYCAFCSRVVLFRIVLFFRVENKNVFLFTLNIVVLLALWKFVYRLEVRLISKPVKSISNVLPIIL